MSSPAGPFRARSPNGFVAFCGEKRPLVSGDSGVEEVYSENELQGRPKCLGCRTHNLNFWGVRTPTTPTMAAPLTKILESI